MRRYFLVCSMMAAALFVSACAQSQLAGLNLGINVSKQYLELRERYVEVYETSTPEMREYMQEHIAPEMNRAREAILEYNDMVLRGVDPEEQREVIIDILIEINRMMEVV